MKRNLLIGTSLVAAFATTSLDARSFSVMTEESRRDNTALSSAIHIVTEGHKRATATGEKALKAGDTDAFAAVYQAAAAKVTPGKDGKVTIAAVVAELAKNSELKKLVAEHRKEVVAATAAENAAKAAKVDQKKAAVKKAADEAEKLKTATDAAAATVTKVTGELADLEAKLKTNPDDAEVKTALEAKKAEKAAAEKVQKELSDKLLAAESAKVKAETDLAAANTQKDKLIADALKKEADAQAALLAANKKADLSMQELQKKLADAEENLKAFGDRELELTAKVDAADADKVLSRFISEKETELKSAESALQSARSAFDKLAKETKVFVDGNQEGEVAEKTLAEVMAESEDFFANLHLFAEQQVEFSAAYASRLAKINKMPETNEAELQALVKAPVPDKKWEAVLKAVKALEAAESELEAVKVTLKTAREFQQVLTPLTTEGLGEYSAFVADQINAEIAEVKTLVVASLAQKDLAKTLAYFEGIKRLKVEKENFSEVKELLDAKDLDAEEKRIPGLKDRIKTVQDNVSLLKSDDVKKAKAIVITSNGLLKELRPKTGGEFVGTAAERLETMFVNIERLKANLNIGLSEIVALKKGERLDSSRLLPVNLTLTAETVAKLKDAVDAYIAFVNEVVSPTDIELLSDDQIQKVFGRDEVKADEDNDVKAAAAVSGKDVITDLQKRFTLENVRADREKNRKAIIAKQEGIRDLEARIDTTQDQLEIRLAEIQETNPDAVGNYNRFQQLLAAKEEYSRGLGEGTAALERVLGIPEDKRTKEQKDWLGRYEAYQKEANACDAEFEAHLDIVDKDSDVQSLNNLSASIRALIYEVQTKLKAVEADKEFQKMIADQETLERLFDAVSRARAERLHTSSNTNAALTTEIAQAINEITAQGDEDGFADAHDQRAMSGGSTRLSSRASAAAVGEGHWREGSLEKTRAAGLVSGVLASGTFGGSLGTSSPAAAPVAVGFQFGNLLTEAQVAQMKEIAAAGQHSSSPAQPTGLRESEHDLPAGSDDADDAEGSNAGSGHSTPRDHDAAPQQQQPQAPQAGGTPPREVTGGMRSLPAGQNVVAAEILQTTADADSGKKAPATTGAGQGSPEAAKIRAATDKLAALRGKKPTTVATASTE